MKGKNILIFIATIFLLILISNFPFYMEIEQIFAYTNPQKSNYFNILIEDGITIRRINEEAELGQYALNNYSKYDKKQNLDYYRVLKANSIGTDVKELNIALSYLGYNTNPDSATYSKTTQKIIKWFQRNNKLKVDGVAGPNTISQINQRLNSAQLKVPDVELKTKKKLSNSFWIVINKDINMLFLYKGYKLIRQYPVATGKNPNDTPEGVFKIVKKNKDPYWGGGRTGEPVEGGSARNPLGTRWLGLSYGSGRWYGIHGTNNPNSIGKHVSHGCIRMHNKHVEELYDLISPNTSVVIGRYNYLIGNIYY